MSTNQTIGNNSCEEMSILISDSDAALLGQSEQACVRNQPSRNSKQNSKVHPTDKKNKNDKNRTERKIGRRQLQEKIQQESPSNQFNVGEIVFGSIPGFSPWPARIKLIQHETILIEFFGTGQL